MTGSGFVLAAAIAIALIYLTQSWMAASIRPREVLRSMMSNLGVGSYINSGFAAVFMWASYAAWADGFFLLAMAFAIAGLASFVLMFVLPLALLLIGRPSVRTKS